MNLSSLFVSASLLVSFPACVSAATIMNKCFDGEKITYVDKPCIKLGLKDAGTVVNTDTVADVWTLVGGNDSATAYVNLADIRKTGDRARLWTLISYQKAIALPDGECLSDMTQEEFNCIKEQRRTLYYSCHTKNMGAGKVISSDPKPHDWHPISSKSMSKILFEIACEKK